MDRLAHLGPMHVGLACAAWVGLIALLPRLTLLALLLHARIQAWRSPTSVHDVAFAVSWGSQRAMLVVLAAPPLLLLCAWMVSRLAQRS